MPPAPHRETDAPRIGISSCLLGNPVRYDGGHEQDEWVTRVLGPFVEFVVRGFGPAPRWRSPTAGRPRRRSRAWCGAGPGARLRPP